MSEPTHDNAGVIAPPPAVYLGPLLIGLLIQKRRPAALLPNGLDRVVGWPLVVGGIALNAWLVRTMRRAHTPIDPRKPVTRLVTEGPFRLSRNPSYTSFTMMYVGIASLVNTRWPILFLPAVLGTMRRGVIEREERYLERTFGDEYRRYKARVRRWV